MTSQEILKQAIDLTPPDYCYPITLKQRILLLGHDWSYGRLYIEIDKMEKRGIIRTELVPGGPERGGKRRLKVILNDETK